MKRLVAGDPAVPFSTMTVTGQPLNLTDLRGQPTLLNLFRYTGCPLCSLNYWYLIQRYPLWHAQGLQVVTIFDSVTDDVEAFAAKQGMQFPVIADAKHEIYRSYGSNTSWLGFLWGFIRHRDDYAESRRRGLANSRVNGTINRMPAQFLINPDLTIDTAYYGKDFGDFLPFAHIEQFLQRTSPGQLATIAVGNEAIEERQGSQTK